MDRGRERDRYDSGKGGKGRFGSRGPPPRSGSRGPERNVGRSPDFDDRRRDYDDTRRDFHSRKGGWDHDRDFDSGKGKGRGFRGDHGRSDHTSPRGNGGFRSGGKKGGKGGFKNGKKGGKGGKKGSKKGYNHQSWIRRQIEFYLSSENLNVDGKTLAAFEGAWIPLEYILHGQRLAAKEVGVEEALCALDHSKTVEYKQGRDGYLLSVIAAPTDEDTRQMTSTLHNWQRTIRSDPYAMEKVC